MALITSVLIPISPRTNSGTKIKSTNIGILALTTQHTNNLQIEKLLGKTV